MKKREQAFTTYFRHWLKANPMDSAAFELKDTRGKDYFPYSELKQHQIDALKAVQETFSYKIPDDSLGSKPFDLIYYNSENAFVVIKYPRAFYIISIDSFLKSKRTTLRKSLVESEAKCISYVNHIL